MTDAAIMMNESPRTSDGARPQDELLPFLNNFHDIFTTIGVLLLGGGLAFGAAQVFQASGQNIETFNGQALLMGLIAGIGVILWLISAVLVGSQRRILPGIALSLGFVGTAATVLVWLYIRFLMDGSGISFDAIEARFDAMDDPETFDRATMNQITGAIPLMLRIAPIVAGLAVLIPIALYYFSFRLPFAGGLFGVALVSLAGLTLLTFEPYYYVVYMPTVNVVLGGALLFAGIMFDARDPGRQTRLAGTAFWLHFFAAPILLFAVLNVTSFGWTLSESDFTNVESTNLIAAMSTGNENATGLAITALVVIAVFAVVSLLINRRALIVSGLLTAGLSIAVIVQSAGLGAGAVVAVTLLLLGGTVVLLGAAWNPVRRVLLAPFPSSGPLARIFPPVNAHEG
ncbi:hypothetical protein L5876_03610 [Hyphobacterium sp. SN044]|uniref:hypothetical protein n=1 Tax=Hyphobacterium sp. SN044 TaxID=2912575 RepID=UPI001F359631|nr:hypothetical protein [Hyphobacterium sp. SN044]MCF8878899.1 hypothetical protein [Hyphobacterium sp. SN044]